MGALVFAAVGAIMGLGVLLLVSGARGVTLVPRLRPTGRGAQGGSSLLLRVTAGLVLAAFVLLLTGWPVAAAASAVVVVLVPKLFGGQRQQREAIDRTQAIASWTEMIRDNLAGAAGLEQALLATAPLAPAAIAPELARFEARLERHVPLVDALAALGDDLHHPSADLVVVAIAKASRMEVRELNPLLSRLSESIRDDVRMRLRVEVSRARIRQSSRIVVGFTLAFIVFLLIFARNLLRPYDQLSGQLWMCVVVGVFAGAGWLIHHYSELAAPVRFALPRSGASLPEASR
jgi:tight adherence protein B